MFDYTLQQISEGIEKRAVDRQRHWSRIVYCQHHEYPYRRQRIVTLTREVDDLYAEKRRLRAGQRA